MNKMIKYTNVFPPAIKPFHIGVYMASDPIGVFQGLYSYWNGSQWAIPADTIEIAEGRKNRPSIFQDRYWRGISK